MHQRVPIKNISNSAKQRPIIPSIYLLIQVAQKILQFIKSEYELFKPHQDLLPTFFQFYEGLIKKGYDKKADYVSPYRPAELKKYPTKI